MRIGLIGLGRIGVLHAENIAGLDGVAELLITDARPGAAEAVAVTLAAKPAPGQRESSGPRCVVTAVPSARDLLAADLDGVVIATPTATHLELLESVIGKGLPTFCEKPVAADPAAASYLLAIATDSGTPVQIGFPRRFDPAFQQAKQELDSGVLGRLTTVRSTTLDPAPPSPEYVAASGGIFRDCSIHDLDAVRWVTGREVVEVVAVGSDRGAPFFRAAGDVDTASILLILDDGTIGVISNSRYNGRGYDVRLELHGSLDAIAAGLDPSLPLRSADPGVTFPDQPPHTFFTDRFAVAFRAELAAFTEVIRGAPSLCTLADGLEASWLAEACHLSYAQHRPVILAEIRSHAG